MGSSCGPGANSKSAVCLVVPWSGRRFLARIGAEIGTYDRSALQATTRTMIGGGIDLHRSASFRPPKPERANRDKFSETFWYGMLQVPQYYISLGFLPICISAWSAMMKNIGGRRGWSGRSDRADPARFRKGGWGWKQISLIVIGSVQIRASWSADRGAIGQIRDN